MRMSFHDAQLTYDGAIPPGVIDHSLPDRYRAAAHAVRVGAVRLKPEVIIARMARQIAQLMAGGTVTQQQLKLLGYSDDEITRYSADALRAAHIANPTFETVELVA